MMDRIILVGIVFFAQMFFLRVIIFNTLMETQQQHLHIQTDETFGLNVNLVSGGGKQEKKEINILLSSSSPVWTN